MIPTTGNASVSPMLPADKAGYREASLVIIEDDRAHGRLLSHLLVQMGFERVQWFQDSREGLCHLRTQPPDLLLLDHHMPHLSGLELLAQLPEEHAAMPVVMMTADLSRELKYRAYEAGVTDFLLKPIDRLELSYKLVKLLRVTFQQRQLLRESSSLASVVAERTAALQRALEEKEQSHEEALKVAGLALEFRDYETKGHTERVTSLAEKLGQALRLSAEDMTHLRWGAYLHDVGKIAIPDQVLLKPTQLTPEEFAIIKSHVVIGETMLRRLSFLDDAVLAVVRHHHERWDGHGYPDGLKGHAIPLLARVFSVVDVYDALISPRPYKEAWPHEQAVRELVRNAGRQFDPEVIAVFLEVEASLARA